MTSADGLFLITGLPAGPFVLGYRNCLARPGTAGNPAALALGPGPLAGPAAATRGFVTSGHVTMLGRITVRSWAAGGRTMGMPALPTVRRVKAAQLRRRAGQQHFGGISGRVVGPHGRPIKGLCFSVNSRYGSSGAAIGADGRYHTGKEIPPGTYTVDFSAACSFPFGTASANWATQWYRGKFRSSAANPVVVKAGQITKGIDGVMHRGAVIEGTVTGHAGRGLTGVCVVALSGRDTAQQVETPRDGQYRFQGLDPGKYNVGFFPHCSGRGPKGYLPQWWPGTASPTKRGLVKVGLGTVMAHVDAKLVLGGTISGVVKFRNSHGQPLKGICVDASPSGQQDGEDFFVSTNAQGKYAIGGLPGGRYAVSFSPGCNNNGNYLAQNYPHSVTAAIAEVKSGIDAYLQPGAIVTGTVTAKAGGARLPRICVSDGEGFSITETSSDGAYVLDQLPPGPTQIEFFNCGKGNFAPQFYPGQLNAVRATTFKLHSGRVVKGINAAMAPGGTISGSVTMTTGAKPSNVCVEADPLTFDGDLGGGVATIRRGSYSIQNLPPTINQVSYLSCGGPNIADSWFAGPGDATTNEARADQLYVGPGGVVSHVDSVLRFGGSVSGWVYGPKKQLGSFICISVGNNQADESGFDFFPLQQGDGYTIFGFAPGRYVVEFEPCGGQNQAIQWYNRASTPAAATPVLVRPRHVTMKVNAHMTAGGLITGRVTSKLTGKPLSGVCVDAIGINEPFFGAGASDRSGKYVVPGLNSGSYRLIFTSCGRTGVAPQLSGAVKATAGKTVTGPSVAMVPEKNGTISGTVEAAGSPRQLVAGACVDAFRVGGGLLGEFEGGTSATGNRGRYEIPGLLPGKYKVLVGDLECSTDPTGLVPQWYRNASQESRATVVTVAPGRTTGSISATLARDGSISGTVTGPKPGGKPLAGICVQILPAARGANPSLAETAAPDGSYQAGPLPPGRYRVEFESGCGATGFATQWWRGAASMKAATTITVRAGRTTTGISASMTRSAG